MTLRRKSSSVLLGFYRNDETAREAIRALRCAHFVRSAILTRDENGKISTQDNDVMPREAALLGIGVGLFLALLFFLFASPLHHALARQGLNVDALFTLATNPLFLLIFPLVGAASGFLLAKALDFGVSNRLLKRNALWVTREETLVVVLAPESDLARAHEILRTTGNQGPTVFVQRPARALRERLGLDRQTEPERFELLAGERLQIRAKKQAEAQRISKISASRSSHDSLLQRLRDTQITIETVEKSLTQAASLEQSVSISAEWLLDNAYIVQSQIKDVRSNLTTGFYRELPVIAEGKDAGTPRIYSLAADLIANTDARIDRENMSAYLHAYQEIEPLKLSELWAMPLMLRMALIEKLRFLTVRIDERQGERERADFWANRLLAAANRDADQLMSQLAELTKENPNVSLHFANRLASQLYDEEAALSGVRSWLERKFDRTLGDIVQGEGRRQAADQVAIANIITSLRQLLDLDWREIFEEVSLVHQTLGYDPARVYGTMDFATRDRYRHAVEGAARKLRPTKGAPGDGHAEIEVARSAINLAVAAPDNDGSHRKHVGYYLVDDGAGDLYRRLEVPLPPRLARQRWIYDHAATIYIGGIVMVTTAALALFVEEAREAGTSWALVALLAALGVFTASEFAVQLWDYILTRVLPPRPLAKMSFLAGVPNDWKTLVVVPMMLTSHDEIAEDLERLEVRHIANPGDAFKFALLADFTDAAEPHTPDDESLLGAAMAGIERLNERHGDNTFFLFHRQRQWAQSEGKWIGWERKRGKLEELNEFLVHSVYQEKVENSILRAGDAAALRDVAFVITLDADTQLPHDSARRLVETLAHPLNRPQISSDGKRVERGYTIIQPRVSTALPSAISTRFTRLFTDARGNDPYTHLVSNVYQDLTGEGAYHGKGIYDLRAFSTVLQNRFPTDTLLSHDLLEGSFVRVGLATDIELFDAFPDNYLTFAKRDHRWIRGDWQIAPWLKKRVPAHGNTTEPNVLSAINKWKIFDNLRRSLVPIFVLAFLVGSWFLAPNAAKYAAALVLGLYFLPPVAGFFSWISGRPWRVPFPARDLRNAVGRSLLNIALLPQRASLSIDAVVRVLYRRFISHKNLLEWTTASAAARGAKNQQARFFKRLLWSSVWALALAVPLVFANWFSVGLHLNLDTDGTLSPFARSVEYLKPLLPSVPFLALWFLAPFWIKWLSSGEEVRSNSTVLNAADRLYVRRIARETWRYFDDFIGAQTNWLPPDNYQEYLNVELAPRTSPTNLGLWYLGALAARDFGYITADQAIDRAAATTETLESMERYEGHFLNWYDIYTTQPLNPRYVSTVDSGNLLVSFWAFSNGVRDLTSEPVLGPSALHGLADTLALLKEKTENLSPNAQGKIATLERLFADPPTRLDALLTRLRTAGEPAYALTRIVRETSRAATALDPSVYWADALERQVAAWNSIIDRYLVWAFLLMEQSEEALRPLGEAAIVARREALKEVPSLEQVARGEIAAVGAFTALQAGATALPEHLAEWLARFVEESARSRWLAGEMLAKSELLVEKCDTLADEMKLGFLYDPKRKLFHIGYNVGDRRLDNSYYDLIASECRLASFAAIARGEVPAEHWIKLRRLYVSNEGGNPALMSWSGTMFEYLMPLLFTHQYPNSLLDYGCRTAVEVQQKYGRNRGIPWGISEAAFSALDAGKTYQYHAFGAPGLALKRGVEDDLVVAPYATALALQVDAPGSIENMRRLEKIGMRGAYGFYESIDYTRQRVPEGERGVIVRNFMVHHHGMSLLAFANVLHDGVIRERFHADPRVQAAAPLLYESVPLSPPVLDKTARERRTEKLEPLEAATSVESFGTPDTPTPRVNLLSNGNYSLAVTNAGGGYARWKEFDITRWRSDTTRDDWGQFLYVRDLDDRSVWSAAFQPTMRADKRYNATFSPDKATFRRRDNEIETFSEIIVSPEDDVEIRRVTLTNYSKRARRVELTSYNELALAPHAADRAHPAFSKLFIQTEAIADQNALVAWRRPRSPKDEPIWAAHRIVAENARLDYETDRARFIGRGRTNANPVALENELTQTDGAVLDPIFALRHRVRIAPGERVEVFFLLSAGDSKSTVLATLEKYADAGVIGRAFDLAWTNAQLEMHRLRIATEDVSYFQQLASHMMYPAALLRAPARRIRANRKQQRALWAYGISGDLPILLVSISNARDVRVVKQLLQAHTFWRVRGLKCDLVILDEDAASYEQTLTSELKRLVQSNTQYTGVEVPGGVFLRGAGQLPEEDLTLLQTVARVSLLAARGNLAQQLGAISSSVKLPPRLLPAAKRWGEEPSAPLSFMELPYFNGLGGFSEDGREYVVYLGPGAVTPAPWCNVMANENFGALVSESGPGFCWSGNSQMNRITPWSNDPVTDVANDAIYIRDDETGTFWTPTPLPIRENDAYRTRHGQGYSIYEHNSHAIEQTLTVFVPQDEDGGAPVRVQRLRLRNGGSRRRKISVMSFNALTLGTTNEETITNIVTSWDESERVLLARNAYHPAFGHKVAFFAMSPAPLSHSGDRLEFLGRNGSAQKPAALGRATLSNRTGAALDPCAALQSTVEIGVGQEVEFIFITGQADSEEQAIALARQWREPDCSETGLDTTRGWWDGVLDTLRVETPDKAVNFLLNRWLVYQDLSCRIWGRSAFYQSGGAYGFRDQLQDTMAMVYARPSESRAQILRAAAHQFVEGDVQHWWHPPLGAGVRTRFSDDLLWLPLVTAHYVRTTGDASVLHEDVEFIEGKILDEKEHEIYMEPTVSSQRGSILEHCRRSIKKGLTTGPHGLPLIGIGDWNDGMSRVGVAGKGESVWLAWFLIVVLRDFAGLLKASAPVITPELQTEIDWCESEALKLAATVEKEAWDGEYYIRAYFDNGEPLGSRRSDEAQIDSLPQSWAILSGAANAERAELGMQAVEKHLVREKDEMILLFTPPFDKSLQDPGYIKGYVPGVRENGGQYTHAAIWVAQATARKGDGDRAVQLMNLLNPVEHARTPEDVARYQVEPYVITADVYALEGRVGRGGWSWYTGSASWFYRVWIEEILGFHLRGDKLFLNPHIPKDWPTFTIHYRYQGAHYEICVENAGGAQVSSIAVNDQPIIVEDGIPLHTEGHHRVVVRL
ncbi:MAG TPA: glucoamylase family protein [Abditibacteriaceae bacterium]|jgi:cellobiose phosphorylase